MKKTGGFRRECDGIQEYDLMDTSKLAENGFALLPD